MNCYNICVFSFLLITLWVFFNFSAKHGENERNKRKHLFDLKTEWNEFPEKPKHSKNSCTNLNATQIDKRTNTNSVWRETCRMAASSNAFLHSNNSIEVNKELQHRITRTESENLWLAICYLSTKKIIARIAYRCCEWTWHRDVNSLRSCHRVCTISGWSRAIDHGEHEFNYVVYVIIIGTSVRSQYLTFQNLFYGYPDLETCIPKKNSNIN